MSNWNLPDLTTLKTNILEELKGRDLALGTMDPDNETNLPVGWISWNSQNSRFEVYNGTSFVQLDSTYNINVNSFNGQSASFYRNASNLNSGTVPTARLPTASTSARGAVQLSSSTTSTSTSLASTPSAINSVRQIAEGKANSNHSHDAGDLPSSSTTSAGIVRLSSSTTSTSTSLASTPSAINSVRQIAEGKANSNHSHDENDLPNASTTQRGVVQLSSSITSTSLTVAATSSAARAAYNRGEQAFQSANSSYKNSSSALSSTNITFSTNAPSGGANGDIWFEY